jgi:tetratricopeptide (TPR) repeat protein
MKQIIVLLSCLWALGASAQELDYKPVSVMEPATIALNGKIRGLMGGSSSIVEVPIASDIASIQIIYQTGKGEGGLNIFNTAISQTLKSFTGINYDLKIPNGTEAVDIEVLDDNALNNWENGNSYTALRTITNTSSYSFWVDIYDLNNRKVYLLFKSTNAWDGSNVFLKIIGLKEYTNFSKWSKERKTEMFESISKVFIAKGATEDIANRLSDCIVLKYTAAFTPEESNAMNHYQQGQKAEEFATSCANEIQGITSPEQEKARSYGNLGWKAYENGNLDNAILYSEKALQLSKELDFVQFNMGLFFLIKKDMIKSIDYYTDGISLAKKNKLGVKQVIAAAIQDIEDAKKKYPLTDYKEIQDLLTSEMNKY